MPQTITLTDVRRGWIDCDTCGDTLRIFYHHRCPTCHAEFTLPAVLPTEQKESDSPADLKSCRCEDVHTCTLSK